MGLLKWNQEKVRQMSPGEIWMFIVGRVLVALGLGILAMAYFPSVAIWAAIPLIVVGLVLLLAVSRAFFRRSK